MHLDRSTSPKLVGLDDRRKVIVMAFSSLLHSLYYSPPNLPLSTTRGRSFLALALRPSSAANLVFPKTRGSSSSSSFISLCLPRRCFLASLFFAGSSSQALEEKQQRAPPSFTIYSDNLDGYALGYPRRWIEVRGAGADIFFRDPFNLDENVMVNFSSPSSSRYERIEDLGSAEEAAQKVLKQYLTEFMSTRLGVRRESSILSSNARVGGDGKTYYDIEANVKSYASTNQLAVMPQDRIPMLEWDRRYLSVLGVENNRLYELRLQAPERVFLQEESELRNIMDSFKVFKY